MLTRRGLIAGSAVTLLSGAKPGLAQERLSVVASFSILADLVRNVGGERTEVIPLVGPNGDAHVYSPTPADSRKVLEAKLVFTNGLKFEGWIDRLIRTSGTKARVVEATAGIKAIRAPRTSSRSPGHDHGHDHALDPHAWQSVPNVKIYVRNIWDALVKVDSGGAPIYRANTDAYLTTLDQLDREVRDAIQSIPADRRKVITSHDAFPYFAREYGITFIAPQGVSTEAEASAQDVAKIISQIKRQKIQAVFLENVSDPRLLEQIARETGAKIGGTLYSDALSEPSGPAPTYVDLIRHNVLALQSALTS
jgi:zinc/manganese transport system substrate-binding protein